MKLQKTTLSLAAIAIILGGTGAAIEWQKSRSTETATGTATASQFWDLQLNNIQQIAIKTPTQNLVLIQTDNPYNPWQLTQPISSPANPAIVSYLTDLLIEAKSERTFTVPLTQKSDFGLNKPTATIAVQSKDRSTRTLTLGKPDFQNQAIYATIEPNPSSNPLTVNLVSKDFQFAIDRDPSEWKAPPADPQKQP